MSSKRQDIPNTPIPVSAWEGFAKIDSPDARFTAIYDDAHEIAMGAPTRGILKIYDNRSDSCIAQLPDSNGSFMWSADSSCLAFPRWTKSNMQFLSVLKLPELIVKQLEAQYRVLELRSFINGVIEGIDSPIYQTKKVHVELRW